MLKPRGKIGLMALSAAVFLLTKSTFAQHTSTSKSTVFIEAGGGIGPAVYRDKATSPLFYTGPALNGVLNRLKIAEEKETASGVQLALAINSAQVDGGDAGESFFNSLSVLHSRLYQLPGRTDNKWNYLAGGTVIATGNLRLNEALYNSSVGLEAFANLMGAFKVSRDVSRLEEKNRKLWFINYKLKPRQRNLSYQLNIGLWNSSYRNGYAYIDQYGLVNDPKVFGDYELKVFSGMRLSSEIHYTLHPLGAPNNAMRISYVWDALTSGAGANTFDMARHMLRFTLLYNTK